MTTYTRPVTGGTPTTGQVVKAVHVNEPVDQIYDTILAGGITSDQIAAGAVDTSELATEAVTAVKMDGTLPDASEMATSAAPTTDKQLANKLYVDDTAADLSVKAFCEANVTGTLQAGSRNVTSINKDSTGVYTVTFTSAFSSLNYGLMVSIRGNTAGMIQVDVASTTTATVETFNVAGNASDRAFWLWAIE